MLADRLPPIPPPANDQADDRCTEGWLLRTLKSGDTVALTGGIMIELRDHKGRPRLAIRAPREIRAVFSVRPVRG